MRVRPSLRWAVRASALLALGASVAAWGCSASSAVGEPVSGPQQPDGGIFAEGGGRAPDAASPLVTSSGIVVVHASPNLGAFRLCFAGGGDLLPLPDRELMPQSNLVGVEVGAAVRIPSLKALKINTPPSRVTAIPERSLRSKPANAPCSALVCPVGVTGGDCLAPGELFDLGSAPSTLSAEGVHLLVISGCVPGSGDTTTCGAGFNQTTGNAKLNDILLQAFPSSTQGINVQLAQLSPSVESGARLGVKFGPVASPDLDLTVDKSFGRVSPEFPAVFEIKRDDTTVYSQQGFQVETAGATIRQSLASIQALSQPGSLPTDFYAVPSSFVLLLLGEPAQTGANGGPADAGIDPGRALHLLAVPVAAPDLDAGPPDAEPYDANRAD